MEPEFEQLFKDRIKERGYSLRRLSDASGISLKHLEAIANGNFNSLPSSPYFRGYLQKLGEILEFDWETWWLRFKNSGLVQDAGEKDPPSKNRFPASAVYKNWWVAALAIAVVIYFILQTPRIFGRPIIKVVYPENLTPVSVNKIMISGTVAGSSELYINGEFVEIGKDGTWQKSVLLANGLNSFEISAKKFLGGESRVVEQVIYEEPASETTSTESRVE